MELTHEQHFGICAFNQEIKSGTLKATKHGNRWRLRSQDLGNYVECLFGEVGHHHS